MEDDDGLLLNLSADGPAPGPGSKQQLRAEKWRAKRAQKKQQHRRGGQTGQQQPGRARQQAAPAAAAGGSQLKGYSLDLPSTAAPASTGAQPPVPSWQQEGQQQLLLQRQQQPRRLQPGSQREEAADGRPAAKRPRLGVGAAAPPQRDEQQQPQHKPEPNGALPGGPRVQRREQGVLPKQQRRQQRQGQAGAGAEPAPAPRQQAAAQPPPLQAGMEHGASGSRGPAGGRAKPAENRGWSSDEEGKKSKRVGRLRLLSRQQEGREPTPDQDDIRAGSDDEDGDVMTAVLAAVTRDRAVQRELSAARSARFASDGSSSEDEEGQRGAAAQRAGRAGRESAAATGRGGGGGSAANPFAPAGGGSSGDEEERPAGVVEFGGDYGDADDRPARKKLKKERQQREGSKAAPAAAAPRTHVSVKPGELVHGGGGAGEAAARAGEVFGSDVGSFQGLGLSQALSDHLASLKFEAPTRVQQQAIPPLLQGRDALVHAATGSGKTLVYLAPIVDALAARRPRIQRSDGTHALIITPTRELCLQVTDVLTLLVRRFVWVVGGGVHGGEHRGKEKARLRKGVTVLVATPGRLLDHLQNTQAFRTDELRWLVLDEADRLLDLGFEKKIAEIVGILDERCRAADYSAQRQTALLSATLHSNLGALAALSLTDPVAVGFSYRMEGGKMVITQDRAAAGPPAAQLPPGTAALQWHKAAAAAAGRGAEGGGAERYEIPKQLQQRFVEVPCKLRLVVLAGALRARVAASPSSAKAVVFFSNCDSVEFYHAVLAELWEGATGEPLLPNGVPILKLHGNLTQAERTEAFLRFTKCAAGVLLCTDVAARGLDFPAVTTILQFDPPGEAADYVHRVGRTARLGQRGDALLCLLPSEREYVGHLRQHGVTLQEQPLASLLSRLPGVAGSRGGGSGGGMGGSVERHQGAYELQKALMDAVAADKRLKRLAEDAFRSFVRAYATHSTELKPIFHIKSLHLGHVAHSFALRERPTMVGQSSSKAAMKKRKAEAAKAKGRQEKGKRRRVLATQGQGDAMAGYHLT